MNFAAGLTLFQPDIADIEYINALTGLVDKVYLYDNSADNSGYAQHIHPDCVYHFDGSNDGLSMAFNWCIDLAQADGMDHLLLLDQDSRYELSVLAKLLEQIKTEEPDQRTALRTYNVQEPDGKIYSDQDNAVVPVKCVITSGSILDLAVVRAHGLRYDEDLFVDHVDHAFCKQILDKGLQMVCYSQYVLSQQLGYLYHGRVCHSAVRHYYMVRDLGYWNRKYYGKFKTFYRSTRYLFRDIFVCLKEDKRWKKIRYALRGYFDYLLGRHGEYKKYHK